MSKVEKVAAASRDGRYRSLVDAGIALGRELALDPLLERIVQTAAALTDARYAALGVIDLTGRRLERFLTAGIDADERAAIGPEPRGEGILGLVIREPVPVRLRNLSEHPRSVGFPPGHPEMTSFLGVPIVLQGSVFGNLYLTDKNGGEEFTDEDEETIVLLAAQAAVAIANHRLYESARGWARQLEAVAEIGDVLVSRASSDELNQVIVNEFRGLVEAESATLLLRAEDGSFDAAAVVGEALPSSVTDRLPPRYLEQLARGATLRIHAAAEDPFLDPELARALGAVSLLGVPLIVNERVVGCVLAVCDRRETGHFSEAEVRGGEVFAARAAVVLELSRRVTRESVDSILRAQEQERRHLGLELHDQTGQELTAALLMLRSIENALPDTELVSEEIVALRALLTESLRGVRRLSVLLRPPSLGAGGLLASIEHLADQLGQRTGLVVRVMVHGEIPSLGEDEDARLYRVVQEALTNVVRHAQASRATVRLRVVGRRLTVAIEDDGVGIAPDVVHGVGLSGLYERVALLGGRFEILPGPGSGTTVNVEVPLP